MLVVITFEKTTESGKKIVRRFLASDADHAKRMVAVFESQGYKILNVK